MSHSDPDSVLRPGIAQWRIEHIRKCAPWLDMGVMRQRVVDLAEQIKSEHDLTDLDKKHVDDFISGERHYLPRIRHMPNALWEIMVTICNEDGVNGEAGGVPFERAYYELTNYFFAEDWEVCE